MRSTRTSAAWAAVAIATSLLSMTIVSAQTTTTVATKGVAKCVTQSNSRVYALTSDNPLYVLKSGAPSSARDGGNTSDGGNLHHSNENLGQRSVADHRSLRR